MNLTKSKAGKASVVSSAMSEAAKIMWQEKRKKYTPEQISEMMRKNRLAKKNRKKAI